MNVKGLSDLNKKGDDKKDPRNRETYVGGEKSGLAVQDGRDDNPVEKLLNQARQRQGEQPSENEAGPNSTRITITLYRDGFMLSDENVLRSYADAKNKKLMEELMEGVVPEELRKKYKSGLEVALQDARDSDFAKAQPAQRLFFQGEGVSLAASGGQAPPKSSAPAQPLGALELQPASLKEGEETFELQLRFANNERKVLKVSASTRLAEVREIVQKALKTAGFKITTVFPVKDVTHENATLKELDLLDSSVNVNLL